MLLSCLKPKLRLYIIEAFRLTIVFTATKWHKVFIYQSIDQEIAAD